MSCQKTDFFLIDFHFLVFQVQSLCEEDRDIDNDGVVVNIIIRPQGNGVVMGIF